MKWPLVIILPILSPRSALPSELPCKAQRVIKGSSEGCFEKSASHLKRLKRVKYFMINGLLQQAKRELQKLDIVHPPLKLIRDRYLATVFSLQNEWAKSQDILNQSPFQTAAHYPQICLLKVLSLMALNKPNSLLQRELGRCFKSDRQHKEADLTWLRMIVPLEESLLRGLPPLPHTSPHSSQELRQTALWLKEALYRGQEKTAFKELQNIPPNFLPLIPERIRELIGLVFYRAGKKKKALDLIKDINLPNAHNIRAYMALQNKDYQKSYGSFQLALEKKENSLNALQAILPLSWIKKNFLEGLRAGGLPYYLGRSPLGNGAFPSALLSELGENTKALQFLLTLKEQQRPPKMAHELLPFNYLMLARPKKALVAAYESCLALNGVNCYLLTLLTKWEDLPQRLQEKKSIGDPHDIDLTQLSTASIKDSPLIEEKIFIDQKHIEELDFRERQRLPFWKKKTSNKTISVR